LGTDRNDDVFNFASGLDMQPYALGTELESSSENALRSLDCKTTFETLEDPTPDLLGEALDIPTVPTTFAGYGENVDPEEEGGDPNPAGNTTNPPTPNGNATAGANPGGGGAAAGGDTPAAGEGGETCCFYDPDAPVDASGQPIQNPDEFGPSIERIGISFLVSNLDYITIPAEVNRSGLAMSYPIFIGELMAKFTTVAPTDIRQRRRYLRSTATTTASMDEEQQRNLRELQRVRLGYVPGSAYINAIEKIDCLGENVHPDLICHNVRTVYSLTTRPARRQRRAEEELLEPEQRHLQEAQPPPRDSWKVLVIQESYRAIYDGTFFGILKQEVPDSPLFIGTIPPESATNQGVGGLMWGLVAGLIALFLCSCCLCYNAMASKRRHEQALREQKRALLAEKNHPTLHVHHAPPINNEVSGSDPRTLQGTDDEEEDQEEFLDEDAFMAQLEGADKGEFVENEDYEELLLLEYEKSVSKGVALDESIVLEHYNQSMSRGLDHHDDRSGVVSLVEDLVEEGDLDKESEHTALKSSFVEGEDYEKLLLAEYEKSISHGVDMDESIVLDRYEKSMSRGLDHGDEDHIATIKENDNTMSDDEEVDWEDEDGENVESGKNASGEASDDDEAVDWEEEEDDEQVGNKLLAANTDGSADDEFVDWEEDANDDPVVNWEEAPSGDEGAASDDDGVNWESGDEGAASDDDAVNWESGDGSDKGATSDDDEVVNWDDEDPIENTGAVAAPMVFKNKGSADNVAWDGFDDNDEGSVEITFGDDGGAADVCGNGSDSIDWEGSDEDEKGSTTNPTAVVAGKVDTGYDSDEIDWDE